MENEFFVTSVKEKCTYFDITCKETDYPGGHYEWRETNRDDAWRTSPQLQKPKRPGFTEKMPGPKSVKIKLENAGAYDIDLLNAAMASGKKVKITIVD